MAKVFVENGSTRSRYLVVVEAGTSVVARFEVVDTVDLEAMADDLSRIFGNLNVYLYDDLVYKVSDAGKGIYIR